VTHATLIAIITPFSWRGFWQLLKWSTEPLLAWPIWIVSLCLTANLGIATIRAWRVRDARWKKEYWLAIVSLFFVPAVIAIGVVGWVDPSTVPRPQPNTLLIWANNGLFAISLLLGIYWIYRMKGLRWLAVAFTLLQLWIIFFAGFIAGMALTGDWL